MSEMRWNPLLNQWVVTATHRQDRTYKPPKEYCPLCPTAPGAFPTEVPAEEYEIVVFENRFPSFRPDPPAPDVEGTELYPVRPAQGVCEVVLYSQDHEKTIADLPLVHVERLVDVWTDRYIELGERPEIEYVFIFENKGEAVGVTLHHPHGQIYAFPTIPPIPARELESGRAHRERTGRCLMCDIVGAELEGPRVVWEDDHFAAYVPFFARYPYEVHLASKKHRASLADLSEKERKSLAKGIQSVAIGYDGLFGFSLPYMMVMHQSPTIGGTHPDAHYHVEFYPLHRSADKLKYLAGVESGAGNFITDLQPEEQAEAIRSNLESK